jgi:hypothetical protein
MRIVSRDFLQLGSTPIIQYFRFSAGKCTEFLDKRPITVVWQFRMLPIQLKKPQFRVPQWKENKLNQQKEKREKVRENESLFILVSNRSRYFPFKHASPFPSQITRRVTLRTHPPSSITLAVPHHMTLRLKILAMTLTCR